MRRRSHVFQREGSCAESEGEEDLDLLRRDALFFTLVDHPW